MSNVSVHRIRSPHLGPTGKLTELPRLKGDHGIETDAQGGGWRRTGWMANVAIHKIGGEEGWTEKETAGRGTGLRLFLESDLADEINRFPHIFKVQYDMAPIDAADLVDGVRGKVGMCATGLPTCIDASRTRLLSTSRYRLGVSRLQLPRTNSIC